METLYFNGAVDSNWTTLGNWWMDDAFTVPATSLPTSIDSVIANANITASGQTVANFDLLFNSALNGDLTVTGNATFNGYSGNNDGYVTARNNFYGLVNGDATFRGSAYNKSNIGGNVILAYEKGINGSSILGIV